MELSKISQRQIKSSSAREKLQYKKFLVDHKAEPLRITNRFWRNLSKNIQGKCFSSSTLKHNHGFILVSATIILMLLISSALAVGGTAWFIIEKQKMQLSCQRQLLKAQKELILGTENIIQLNSRVLSLIQQKNFLIRAIDVAPTPIEKTALMARLALVITKMVQLRTKQNIIIQRQELKANAHIWSLKNIWKRQIRDLATTWEQRLPSPQISTTQANIKIFPVYQDPILPIYQRLINYEHAQTLHGKMTLSTSSFFPSWISFLKLGHFYWQEVCYSHPQKGGLSWIPQIGAGKLFGKHSSLF